MILFFGTRLGKKESTLLKGISCPYCEQKGTLTAVSQPNYVHFFWIPIFTLKTEKYVECNHCKRVFYEEEFTREMEQAL